MSENGSTGSGGAVPRAQMVEILSQSFARLPDVEQNLFNYGPLYLAGNAAFAGLVANSLYRRVLNVSHARFASSLPMAVLPFVTTAAFYNAIVCLPLLSGSLDCPSCTMIRGALVGAVCGGVYPVLLALPINIGLAARCNSAPMPDKGNALRFAADLARPVLLKMRPVFVLQALFGTYLGSRHFDTSKKLVELTTFSEELND